ncbi:ribonuclease, Rne/Rng family [Spongiibacter sp. IMCC21906]|jgi:ribonuclease G|uniref:ribonuclease G n=1 Tax=Spongiibacter sp. IMCC21906 TaxID=1620392 RepID=UPI00062DE1E2|nr:ribonuclease G [Spongiibacter sp. IMCC21906]AKH68851.1 ribonuclease, Rne/Rng family [Spongiibacter sp. IMCC21906]
MSEEILINVTPVETRVATVENGVLQEVYIERSRSKGIVGNIYQGKVVRVLPGMQAAFVDIGLERTAFIHASDIAALDTDTSEHADIRSKIREGQQLTVQVSKDPMGTKGARLTTRLSVSSRFLVFMPGAAHIGVSHRIDDETERQRLRTLVESVATGDEADGPIKDGYIVRTVAEGMGDDEVRADVAFLHRLWAAVERRMKRDTAPSIIYEDLPLFMRTMRDLVRPGLEKIRIDSRESFQRVSQFAQDYLPEISAGLEYYPGERPIFDLYSVEDEIQKALGRKVELKSGGYLIIDQTEAMTTIDINTGAFVGHRNLEETIFKTNLEAAASLARQLRLRNLGGIIIIDFIDMKDAEHRRQVLRALEKAMEKDYAKTSITGVSELGLVEMTRKRTRESLEHILCETCRYCHGRGSLKSPETVCYEVFREILREARAYESKRLLVLTSQEVVDRLLDEESANVADLEEFIGASIQFQVETMYTQEQFDVVLL